MKGRLRLGAAAAVAIGLGGGWWAGGPAGLIVGGLFGLVAAYAVIRLDVRTAVAVPVVAGTMLGAVIGRSVVRAICLPGTCVTFEVLAAVGTALGALVGVGLVVALVIRSFDEHRGLADAPPPATEDS